VLLPQCPHKGVRKHDGRSAAREEEQTCSITGDELRCQTGRHGDGASKEKNPFGVRQQDTDEMERDVEVAERSGIRHV